MRECKGLFITGTDTGIGKTVASLAIINKLIHQGVRVAGMKPVASGCEMTMDGLRNDDAVRLHAAGNVDTDYDTVNPYAFAPPIAPHLAARETGTEIDLGKIASSFCKLAESADWIVVEGVGGWLVPLGAEITVADLAVSLALPVILIVGMRLGCLNHALLTAQAIQRSGASMVGWVANHCDPQTSRIDENIHTLKAMLPVPLLATLPHSTTMNESNRVDFDPITVVSRVLMEKRVR